MNSFLVKISSVGQPAVGAAAKAPFWTPGRKRFAQGAGAGLAAGGTIAYAVAKALEKRKDDRKIVDEYKTQFKDIKDDETYNSFLSRTQ